MDYIDNITLTILICLLRNRQLTISAPDEETLEDLTYFISNLDILFLNKPENMSIEEEEEFSENYVKTIKYEVRLNTVNISCDNIERIDAFLREYIENYKNGTLTERGDVNRFDTISALHDMLIAKTVGKTTNNVRYIETDIKYAPLILLKYFENNDFIQGLTIQLAPVEEIQYPMILFERSLDGTPEAYTSYWQDYFRCRYVLNMDWYITEVKCPKKKPVTKFSKQQQKMYDIICQFLRTRESPNNFFIGNYCFRKVLNEYNPYEAVKKLNQQYREINGIVDKKVRIIKAVRNQAGYIISKDFNPDN